MQDQESLGYIDLECLTKYTEEIIYIQPEAAAVQDTYVCVQGRHLLESMVLLERADLVVFCDI